jgi:hypothetical protein
MSGTIAPGDFQDITVTMNFADSTFVPDSLYPGTITILNNSRSVPVIPVSVGLRSGVEEEQHTLPREFSLYQNYPNPFNSTTMIRFSLPKASRIKLEIFNILGQKVTTLIDGSLQAGSYNLPWNATGVSSGVYFLRISAGAFSNIRVMSLLK